MRGRKRAEEGYSNRLCVLCPPLSLPKQEQQTSAECFLFHPISVDLNSYSYIFYYPKSISVTNMQMFVYFIIMHFSLTSNFYT